MPRTPESRPLWLPLLRRAGRFLLRIPTPLAWLLVLTWMGLVWALSASTIDPPPLLDDFWWPLIVNLGHAPLFGILALLVAAALLGARVAGDRGASRAPRGDADLPPLSPALALAAVLWAGIWGGIDEWHQSGVPGRYATSLDVATDVVGSLCVVWVVAYVLRAEAEEAGVRWRLLVGVGLCVSAASAVTFLN